MDQARTAAVEKIKSPIAMNNNINTSAYFFDPNQTQITNNEITNESQKIKQNGSDLRRSRLGGYYTKIDSGTAPSKYKCNICGHLSKDSNHMLDHLEGKHFPGMFEYACDSCAKVFDTKPKFYNHRRKEHSNETTK